MAQIFRLTILILTISWTGAFWTDPAQAEPRLLKDINLQEPGSSPEGFAVFGDLVIFDAETPEYGEELWVLDGSEGGAQLLADLHPGPDGSNYTESYEPQRLVVTLNDRLLISGRSHSDRSMGLWISKPWSADFADDPQFVRLLTDFDGLLGLWNDDGNDRAVILRTPSYGPCEIWLVDGSESGMTLLGTLGEQGWPDSDGTSILFGDRLILAGDGVGPQGATGREPWAIDLKTGELILLGDLAPGDSDGVSVTFQPLEHQGLVYFVGQGGSYNSALWQTDGTPEGTRLMVDILPDGGWSPIYQLRSSGDLLFFRANTESSSDTQALWVSDTTQQGTRALTPQASDFNPRLGEVMSLNGKLIFGAEADGLGDEPWISDGTNEGTFRLRDIAGGPQGSTMAPQAIWTRPDGVEVALFRAGSEEYGEELWQTDGTQDGTDLLIDIWPGRGPSRATATVLEHSGVTQLWLQANDGFLGAEPWTYDGEDLRLVSDLVSGTNAGSNPADLLVMEDHLYFQVFSEDQEPIWLTDGTEEGTVPIPDSYSLKGRGSETIFADSLYLVASRPDVGQEIFRIEGENPPVVVDIYPGPEGSRPSDLRVAGEYLYFVLDNGSITDGEVELWSLAEDDTLTHLGDITVDPYGTSLADTSGMEPSLATGRAETKGPYFFGNGAVLHAWGDKLAAFVVELGSDLEASLDDPQWMWIAGDTIDGVQPLAPVKFLGLGDTPTPVALGEILFFVAWDEQHGEELWRSDGTAEGTFMLPEMRPGLDAPYIWDFIQVGSELYFTAFLGDARYLWRTDGTSAGTHRVDIGPVDSTLWFKDKKLYLTSEEPETGLELRRYDVETGVLETLIDIEPGEVWSTPRFVHATEDRLYFRAGSWTTGYSLYVTDGSIHGTRELTDLHAGRLVELGERVLWTADDGVHGVELWVDDVEPVLYDSCPGIDTTLCLGGEGEADERFVVSVNWRDESGKDGEGSAHPLTSDSGAFWFFDADNLELMVKVLDGRAINGHFWVFVGSLSNVEFDLRVQDTQTGESVTYRNSQGSFAAFGDIEAFAQNTPLQGSLEGPRFVDLAAEAPNSAVSKTQSTGGVTEQGCSSDDASLCLTDDRFRVSVTWTDPMDATKPGQSHPLTSDTGAFSFFDADNLELMVKVLDGRAINGHFWVFTASLSDLAFELVVEDVQEGRSIRYEKPAGVFSSFGDTEALPGAGG